MGRTPLAAFRLDAQTRADLTLIATTLGQSQTGALKRLIAQKAAQLRAQGQQPAPWRPPQGAPDAW